MAVDLLLKPNADTTDLAFPFGAIKDAPNGTPVNKLVYNDFHQYFAKTMNEAGIAYNGNLDSAIDGYQLYEAFASLAGLNAWTTGAKPIPTTNTAPVGTVTIDNADVLINKYKIVGKTIYWNLKLRSFTTAGAFQQLYLTSPVAVLPPGWANSGLQTIGIINGVNNLIVETSSVSSAGQITLKMVGGGDFAIGTNNQSLDLTIIAEIL